MAARRYRIELAPTALAALRKTKNRKIRNELVATIERLSVDPTVQGKELIDPLEGLRSVRVARERYRILYRVDDRRRLVTVLLVGPRKPGSSRDIYAVAQKLLRTLRRDP